MSLAEGGRSRDLKSRAAPAPKPSERTGRRGEMGAGRSGPVHRNSGMVMLRAWPRFVQNSQLPGPGLCARFSSGQACCNARGAALKRRRGTAAAWRAGRGCPP